jgi:hypothetical protein
VSGTAEAPTPAGVTHEIVLHGEANDPIYGIDNQITVGNKALINTGQLKLFGAKKTSHARLALSVHKGDKFVFVTDAEGWSDMDRIVISGTGKNQTETEEHVVRYVTRID